MKNIKILVLILVAFVLNSGQAYSQCLNFAKSKGFTTLDTATYIPEGRLSALPLSEGDNMDVYKSFFKGKTYKIVVVGADNIPQPDFKVVNFQQQVIFDSKKNNNTNSWEFTSQQNQNLIISATIPMPGDANNIQTGCIAVIVGFKN
ncbi:MAG: hypothetical protein U9N85_07485 [Bacteroidota bacterium]|nr:hypothetical protein [Bacteroidota bacterium]